MVAILIHFFIDFIGLGLCCLCLESLVLGFNLLHHPSLCHFINFLVSINTQITLVMFALFVNKSNQVDQ